MKTRSIIILGIFGLILGTTATSCDNGKTKAMQSQIDSLSAADSLHQEDIKQMADFVNVMSTGLDSISAQEGVLQQMGSREGGAIDKAKMKNQLRSLAQLLQRQRESINKLEAEVKNNKSAYGKRMEKLIANYKAQLNEKDTKIAELQKQLDEKNVDIAKLTENVNNLTTTNAELQSTVESQNQTMETQQSTIAEQDASLHTGFVIIGTSKELKAKGLIKGGFLAKKKIEVSQLQPGSFSKIDIRNYNDIRLNSSNPKVMTQMPASSYEIQTNSNGTSTLHIKDVTTFWSVSKYLVIRL